ncbi:MAG: hypothetical protein JNK04_22100, partial [Myxococcales bacterium]|nr:hypothetical protein [Myxococcales bacterium]
MRFLPYVLGIAMLVACDDDDPAQGGGPAGGSDQGGSGQGGDADGGAPVGGAPAGDTLTLDIAPDENATVTCATYVDGVWGVAETGFAAGEVSNLDCALVAVAVEGEPAPFWITSRTFEGLIGTEEMRHAFSTADIVIAVGSTPIELQDDGFATLFEGTLET